MHPIEELKQKYEKREIEIQNRLKEFSTLLNESDERIFSELAFCLCTPQSKATSAWRAIDSLTKNNLLFVGTSEQIKPFLNSVRFNENKSKYIEQARKFFSNGNKLNVKNILLQKKNPTEIREFLVENVNGFGMKEASHFLRNIGLGENLAILDVHILKNLHDYGVIEKIPKTLTKKTYLEIEKKMEKFSEQIGIPLAELDLLFWSEETGFIFK